MSISDSPSPSPDPARHNPSLGGAGISPQGLSPGYGFPDEALLTRLANEAFSSPPGSPAGFLPGVPPAASPQGLAPDVSTANPTRNNPSLGGFGASPQGFAPGYGLPNETSLARLASEAFSSTPGLPAGVSPGIPNAPVAAPPQVLVPDVPLATPPLHGAVPGPAGLSLPYEAELKALLGTLAPAQEPEHGMELVPDVSLGGTPPSAGTVASSSPSPQPVPLPYDAELKALLGTIGGETRVADPTNGGSSLYFLKDVGGASADPGRASGIGVPGASGPGIQSEFASAHPPFDVNAIRRDFPILSETVNGRPLVWLDNAATTQKPKAVIDRLVHFYEHENSNIHRAAHELAARSTDAYEGARQKVQRFINAPSIDEIVFTRGTTESINLVAATFGLKHVNEGDEIVITHLEHHANIVPWQQLALAKGAKLRVAPVDDRGVVLLEEYGKLLNSRTKLVAFTQVSNALGTVTPAKQMVEMAKHAGARVLLDGAQSVSHMKVDVQELGPDFFVFSGHKLFGPTGIGVLWGKKDLLNSLPPYQTGGNMIQDVTLERSIFHNAPNRFEAGTGNIADAVGLGAAIDYVERIGLENIAHYEHSLMVYATKRLLENVPGIRIIGTSPEKAGVISLVLKGVPSEEVGARLNKYGIAVRSGHHCAQPILRRFGQETTVRPSFAFYNTCGEIDLLVSALRDIQRDAGQSYL
ncbi:family 2A encapsulin nanocompartment cargo protein cysteine desulfurase [uncultured Hyphomicrobium sp.]|uniref:family 2A encapsulin nanocompartment cargo protein cysteine desulfurase n=1 Tax=uncultured Hyphomicrobium sp. TaxID=194373 RepID=UPI0025D13F22|nr:family 2A encapsulin nanocompartment cargo protein cysteine desulfurase [uncultured Hyphomicrobium sp.]